VNPPFPSDALRAYAARLMADGPPGTVYDQYRALCDAVFLGVEPTLPQRTFAKKVGMSRTTLRSMLRRLGLRRPDGRKAVPS
jgi:hypothetical protein